MRNDLHMDLTLDPHETGGTFYIGKEVTGLLTIVPSKDMDVQFIDYRLQ